MVVRKPHIVPEQATMRDSTSKSEEVPEFIQETHADLQELDKFYSKHTIRYKISNS